MLDWLETHVKRNLRETTFASYNSYVVNHINPILGKIRLQDLNALHVKSLYDYLAKSGRLDGKGGLSGKSIIQVHRILSKALGQAHRLQIITKKATDYVDSPKKKKFKAKVLKISELSTLLDAFRESDIYIGVLLALNLGLRRGEVLGLTWEDIDFEHKTLTINTNLVVTKNGVSLTEPKSEGSNRTLLISDVLITELKKQKDIEEKYKTIFKSDYINHNIVCSKKNGDFIHPGRFSHKFSDGLKKAGLNAIRFHDLRHTNATLMLRASIPAKIASQRLGHSSIGITMDLYSHVINEMQEEAVEQLDALIYN